MYFHQQLFLVASEEHLTKIFSHSNYLAAIQLQVIIQYVRDKGTATVTIFLTLTRAEHLLQSKDLFQKIPRGQVEIETQQRKYIEANDVGEQNTKTAKTMEIIELIIAIFIV